VTVEEVVEALDRWKEDASLYKTYYIKASGENAVRLHEKYLQIITMIDAVEDKFNKNKTTVTEDDFKC